MKLVLRQEVATVPVGDGVGPNPGLACPFEASFDCRLALSNLIDAVLLSCKSHAPATGAGGDNTAGVSVHAKWLLVDQGARQDSYFT